MTRLPVVFHPGVEDDIAAIYDYYEQFDPALPSRFEVRLGEQVERVGMFPVSGAFLFESYRRVFLKRFPYMAVYVVRDDHIDVLAVISVQRDPAWIEVTVTERGDEETAVRKQSATSPAEADGDQPGPTVRL